MGTPDYAEAILKRIIDTEDMEIETPSFFRAREILGEIENKAGKIQLKPEAGFTKTKGFPRKKAK